MNELDAPETDLLSRAWATFERDEFMEAELAFRGLLSQPQLTDFQREQAQYGLSYSLAFSGQYSGARRVFERLRTQAAAQGDAEAQHRAGHKIGMVERMAGAWTAAQTCFEQERRLIESLGEPDLAVAVNAYELGLAALHLGEMTAARTWLDLSLERALRTADLIAVGCA